MNSRVDVLIIGCGIGGASAALRLAKETGRSVTVITRTPEAPESNTYYAQGGIVALGPDDTSEAIVADVLAAGSGASLPRAAELLATEGPRLVHDTLIGELGIEFDRDDAGNLHYTKEGGHAARRVLHAGDATGLAIERAFIKRLAESQNVELRTGATAVELITSSHNAADPLSRYEPIRCHGAYVLDRESGRIETVLANAVILATGGLGRIFRHTTNPRGARGDGLAMAYRAGARIVNAEYVQFHPTTLALPGTDNFLITEAVRGEGGRLRTPDGRFFMQDYAPEWGDLAPRDVVARGIHSELVANDYPFVLLDLATYMDADYIRDHFPTVYGKCLEAGVDMTREPIPVVPAAHYACGGVFVDDNGHTSIERLYAVGEVSCTGVHGANRLASTSLLEGLVWGTRAAENIARDNVAMKPVEIPPWEPAVGPAPDPVLIHQDMRVIQEIMWHYVGLVRNTRRLNRALRDLIHLRDAVEAFYRDSPVTDDLIGLRNALQSAIVVTHSAWQNRQSRGTHYRDDAVERITSNFSHPSGPSAPAGEF